MTSNYRRCFVMGQAGNCAVQCEGYQDGECPEPKDVAAKTIDALTRQRDILAAGLLRIKQMCQPNTLYHGVASKALVAAGMEGKK